MPSSSADNSLPFDLALMIDGATERSMSVAIWSYYELASYGSTEVVQEAWLRLCNHRLGTIRQRPVWFLTCEDDHQFPAEFVRKVADHAVKDRSFKVREGGVELFFMYGWDDAADKLEAMKHGESREDLRETLDEYIQLLRHRYLVEYEPDTNTYSVSVCSRELDGHCSGISVTSLTPQEYAADGVTKLIAEEDAALPKSE